MFIETDTDTTINTNRVNYFRIDEAEDIPTGDPIYILEACFNRGHIEVTRSKDRKKIEARLTLIRLAANGFERPEPKE